MSPIANSDRYKSRNNEIVLHALARLGISAKANERNDITYDGKKVSGSAFKLDSTAKGTKALHHATMLLSITPGSVIKYLCPSKDKIVSKGIASVPSRVLNL
jgi:lipoate-protein ligase A